MSSDPNTLTLSTHALIACLVAYLLSQPQIIHVLAYVQKNMFMFTQFHFARISCCCGCCCSRRGGCCCSCDNDDDTVQPAGPPGPAGPAGPPGQNDTDGVNDVTGQNGSDSTNGDDDASKNSETKTSETKTSETKTNETKTSEDNNATDCSILSENHLTSGAKWETKMACIREFGGNDMIPKNLTFLNGKNIVDVASLDKKISPEKNLPDKIVSLKRETTGFSVFIHRYSTDKHKYGTKLFVINNETSDFTVHDFTKNNSNVVN